MFAVVDWPSNLGLRPSGVESLPSALRRAGLIERLAARDAGSVIPEANYDATRSPETGLLNGPALRDAAQSLARVVAQVMERGELPIVLAGDCSVILGGLLGARMAMRSRVALLFIDGHVDFYQPEASPTGEVADIGARDAQERENAGSQDIRATGISLFELPAIRERGIAAIADDALKVLAHPFWCHLDADVLDDAVMPAVDYRQEGGMTPSELTKLMRRAFGTGRMIGFSIAIYNPALDPRGDGARLLVDILHDAFV